jgi:erythromycin esterase
MLSTINAQTETQIDSSFLIENVKKINSIESTSDNSDLDFLDKELEGVEVVMLGEQSHGDGSTFIAGLADVYRVWKKIQEDDNSKNVFDYGIFPVWTKSEQTEELFKYILERSKTKNPLIITGFDMQPTGSLMTPDKRWSEISDYLKNISNFDDNTYPNFKSVFLNIQTVFVKDYGPEKMKSLVAEFKEISQIIQLADTTVKGKLMIRYINNYLKTIQLYKGADLRKPSNTPHVFNIRDKLMAENFNFIKEELYPHKKYIVWGANSHLGYGRGFLGSIENEVIQGTGMIPMGQYLKIDYQEKLYTIAFTSYEGTIGSLRGNERTLDPALEITLEGMLSKQNYEFAFLSMRNEGIKTTRFATRIYGHGAMSGVWAQMCDGIFFIRTMSPTKLIKD